MFPMKLVVAANHLRSRGYNCRPKSLGHRENLNGT
jgi:hypothetical protein